MVEPFLPHAYLLGGELAASPDDLLVAALQRGEERAYEILVERFEQPVFNLVYRLVCNPADAGDVVQEVFIKVFRKIGSFRGQASLKTWIYRIAVHESYNQRRWFRRHKWGEVQLENRADGQLCLQDVLPDQQSSPFDEALRAEQLKLVEEALQLVNPVFRSAVVLRDLEGLSYDEIADVLQVSIGTVKSRILRGREALRQLLVERLEPMRIPPAEQGVLG